MIYSRVIGMFLVLSIIIPPVNALTADALDIYVLPSGDAVVEFEYRLSFLERITVFLGVAKPEKEIQRAIEDNLGKEVIVFPPGGVVKAQGGPYSQSFSNLDDNIVYIPEPNEDIMGNGMILRLGIKQFATVERVNITNENITLKAAGDPVPGAEIYIEQEPNPPPDEEKSVAGGEHGDAFFDVFTTLELSFADAEEAFNQLWFAPLINMDFSPDVTRVRFPKGDSIKFSNQIGIPPFNYTEKSSATGNKGGFAVGGFSLA